MNKDWLNGWLIDFFHKYLFHAAFKAFFQPTFGAKFSGNFINLAIIIEWAFHFLKQTSIIIKSCDQKPLSAEIQTIHSGKEKHRFE